MNLDQSDKTFIVEAIWTVIYLLINPVIIKTIPSISGSWALVSMLICLPLLNTPKESIQKTTHKEDGPQ